MVWLALVLPGVVIWLMVLALPWRPWGTSESLDASAPATDDLSNITVVIPARNESPLIQATLTALARQGRNHTIVLVDDQSEDATAEAARALGLETLHIVTGQPLPPGWTGKLWALEQGRRYARTELTLLLDADIELQPGIISALRSKMREEGLHLVSLMAYLRMQGFWERLLAPAFVYFFKLLYPFRLSNSPKHARVAAAAGGCMLIQSAALDRMGGFASIREDLIDDCAIARQIKSLGMKTWIGLTHSARSLRAYSSLATFWNMVARTAFHQLHYSLGLLLLCTIVMLCLFVGPVVGLLAPYPWLVLLATAACAMMMASYLPTLRYYGLPGAWAVALPGIGFLYLLMTWTSAARCVAWRRSEWKGRGVNSGNTGA